MKADEEFDYIIVGAGSAGCVLANRLSADGRNSVMLVEAGGRDSNPWIHIPLGYGRLFKDRRYNWMYETEPEPQLNNRRIFQPRGKVLGGSSSINGLVYVRGQREDFDAWREAGNEGWGFEDVLPYFRKAEDQQRGEDAYHGVGGPLHVSDPAGPHVLCEAFIASAQRSGIPFNPDFNGPSQEGVGYFQSTSRRGRRTSAAVAYLRPATGRPNLRIVTNALVCRVVVGQGRATGIEYRRDGKLAVARARREVLLCAGAIGSPQILQLSGIGDPELLRSRGIETVVASPCVGENLQDHLQVRTVQRCKLPITTNDEINHLLRRVWAGFRYVAWREGPLTISAGYAGGFFRTSPQISTPDVQCHFITFSTDAMGEKLHPFPGFTASICQLRPKSRGYVRIRSRDPEDAPAIRVNFLAEESDRATTVAGLQLLRGIMRTKPISELIDEEVEPGEGHDDPEALLEFCRAKGSTIYHPSCTCRMGADEGSVIDPQLRLRGVEGLRVVDGSVMPSVVSGNTNAAIIMIAEKGADMILADAAAAGRVNQKAIA